MDGELLVLFGEGLQAKLELTHTHLKGVVLLLVSRLPFKLLDF